MALKRTILLISVILLSAVLKDMVLPREVLEEWLNSWFR